MVKERAVKDMKVAVALLAVSVQSIFQKGELHEGNARGEDEEAQRSEAYSDSEPTPALSA